MTEKDNAIGTAAEAEEAAAAADSAPGAEKGGCCCSKRESEEITVPDCCRHMTRERSEKEYKDLLNRLSRIEGQVRGIRKMLENNVYCLDIITQVSAVNSALNSFNKVLLANHLKTCVTEDIKEGNDENMDELIRVLPKLMK